MRRIAWANVRGHPLRTLATALSVVLGVAFVTGTFVFTDTVRDAFDQLFGSTVEGADLVVVGGGTGEAQSLIGRGGVPAELADRISRVPGVAQAEARYRGLAKLARADGTALGGFGSVLQGIDAPTMRGAVELRAGALPESDDEVAIDAASAAELNKHVGDQATLLLNGPEEPYRISGIIEPPTGVADVAGSSTVVFNDATAARLYGGDGATYIAVRAADGMRPAALRDQLTDTLGGGYEALTVDELVANSVAQVGEFLGFLTRGLLVFAGAALLVGAIIIFNTFGVTVAQRIRELALVQAVGADSRQIMRAVLSEAVIVGMVGSAAGVAAGVAGAVGLRALLGFVDLPLPSTGLTLEPRTAAIGFGVGLVVTTIAAVGPALRASHRSPVDALRAAPASRAPVSTPRLIAGSLLSGVAASTLIGTGLDRGGMIGLGIGAATLALGIMLLAPLGAGPLTALVGAPVRALRKLPGRLARANAVRNPGRTAATATALLVGLGLVTFVLILVSSFRTSLDQVIVERFRADYQVQAVDQVGYPTEVTAAADKIAGVDLVSAAKVTRGWMNGATRTIFAIDARTLPAVFDFDVFEGSLAQLAEGGVAVSKELGIPLGAEVAVRVGTGERTTRQVVALTEDLHLPGTTRVGQALVDVTAAGDAVAGQQDLVAFVKLAPDADRAAVRERLDGAVADHPEARVADTAELRAQVREQTDRLLGLVIGLALLSVIIAFVGVVNILGLSVVERSDELGLLHALGMTPRQARQMVRWESVIITMLGTAIGLSLGTMFGWLGVRVLRDEGLTSFSLPAEQIVIAVFVMLVAGVFASVVPARRASQADVLRAVTIE